MNSFLACFRCGILFGAGGASTLTSAGALALAVEETIGVLAVAFATLWWCCPPTAPRSSNQELAEHSKLLYLEYFQFGTSAYVRIF